MNFIRSIIFVIVLLAVAFVVASLGNRPQSQEKGTVLVAGASGRTGVHLMQQLTDAGYQVRGLTRNIKNAQEKLPGDYDWVAVDVRKIDTMRTVFADVDIVISVLGSGAPDTDNNAAAVDYGGNKNLIDLAVENDIRKIVLVSSANAGNADPEIWLNKNRGNVLVWKGKAEDHLRASGINYTIVRPGGLVPEYEPGERGLKIAQGLESLGMIHRADLAAVVVAALKDPASNNKTFEVISDADAEPDAWRDDFAALSAEWQGIGDLPDPRD